MNNQIKSEPILQQSALEWINRYVNEVGRRLPPNQRADVEREIHSLIVDEVVGQMDALENEGAPRPEEEAVLAVLQQFGAPEEIAARYYAPRYLIGPGMFPIYRIVLGIVLAATLFASLLGLVVAAGANSAAPLIDTLLGLFGGVLQTVGTVTLIFVALERLGVGTETKPAAWNPRNLPPVKDPERVNLVEVVAEIAFTAAVLALAVLYLNGGVNAVYYDGQWQAIPLFSAEFPRYIPWLAAIWGADILVNIVLLVRGRWEAATLVATMVVSAANGVIFYTMIVGGPIAAWPPLEPAFRITAAVIFAVSLWEVGKHGWRLLRNSGLIGDRLRSQQLA